MTAVAAWALAVAALVAGWFGYGWPGLALAGTCIAFWLLLQFSRTLRVMKRAAGRPVGTVDNAVMLHARLRAGMPLLSVVALARSLGKTIDGPEEAYEWRDASGDRVVVRCARGRCTSWDLLRRPEAGD
jgi:hypothetical protein